MECLRKYKRVISGGWLFLFSSIISKHYKGNIEIMCGENENTITIDLPGKNKKKLIKGR
ncbi:MAG TPA: hypothetical protein VK469_17660 [Candidatus Kapabacteria bacterium]|nr:hypothetical protein [Candidatus Kapabacteria bacterium]